MVCLIFPVQMFRTIKLLSMYVHCIMSFQLFLQPIPPEFLRRGYISEEDLSRPKPAAIFSTSWHVDLEKDGPNVFFAGPLWPKFLEHKNLSETHVLLIKYHGRMTFSLETYGHGNNEHIEEETSSSQQSEQCE